MISLINKVVFITGATSGIGEACAEAFAAEGAKLILTARRIELLKEKGDYIREKYGVEVFTYQLDVRERDAVFNLIHELPESIKEIDILVNNAGLGRGLNKLWEDNPEGWDEMIDTNIKGLLNVTKAILPDMVKRDSGYIINIGSIAGHETYPGGAVYCATKHAVTAITKSLRMDLLNSKVRVSTIDPGMVETNFSRVRFYGNDERADSVYRGMTPLSAEDIADAVIFCATRPSHVTIAEMILYPTDQASATLVNRSI